jgi:hypothetical protein
VVSPLALKVNDPLVLDGGDKVSTSAVYSRIQANCTWLTPPMLAVIRSLFDQIDEIAADECNPILSIHRNRYLFKSN